MARILKKAIDDCIVCCTQYIESSRRHVDGDVGWHQHLGSHKIGIVATAMILLYYDKLGEECGESVESINFIRSKVNPDGGWPYISNTHGLSNVESTCWALLALASCDLDGSRELIINGLNWLLERYENLGYSDNGWSFAGESRPRIYITSFVLKTMYKLGKSDDERFEAARKWIIDSQNSDGGWGELPDRGSSVFYTSYVVNTLLECGLEGKNKSIVMAKEWLDCHLQGMSVTDPALLCYLEFIESGTGVNRSRIPFFHYVAPHVLETYSRLDRKSPQVLKVLKAILDNCKDGIVEHPMLENSKIVPVWALYDTVSGLYDWKNSGWKWDDIYQFALLFNTTSSFGKWNPIGYIASVKQWILNGVLMIVVFMPFLYFYEDIMRWMNLSANLWWGQLLISFLASCLYGLLSFLLGKFQKK